MTVMTPPKEKTDLIPWAKAVDQVPRENWKPILDKLQAAFEDSYSIRRLKTCWLATDLNPNTDTEPTIVADSVEDLVRHMVYPDPRFGRTFKGPWGPDRL